MQVRAPKIAVVKIAISKQTDDVPNVRYTRGNVRRLVWSVADIPTRQKHKDIEEAYNSYHDRDAPP